MDSKNKFSPTVLKIVKFCDKCQIVDVVGDPLRYVSIDITIVKLQHNYMVRISSFITLLGINGLKKTFNSTLWKIVKLCDKCQNFRCHWGPT